MYDNFDMSRISCPDMKKDGRVSPSKSADSNSRTTSINLDHIANLVLKKVGQTYRPSYRQHIYVPPHSKDLIIVGIAQDHIEPTNVVICIPPHS